MGFGVNPPNGLWPSSSGYTVNGNRGVMSKPPYGADCATIFDPRGADNLVEQNQQNLTDEAIAHYLESNGGKVFIFDFSGQYMGTFDLEIGQPNAVKAIFNHVERNLEGKTGMYNIHVRSNNQVFNFKLPLFSK